MKIDGNCEMTFLTAFLDPDMVVDGCDGVREVSPHRYLYEEVTLSWKFPNRFHNLASPHSIKTSSLNRNAFSVITNSIIPKRKPFRAIARLMIIVHRY